MAYRKLNEEVEELAETEDEETRQRIHYSQEALYSINRDIIVSNAENFPNPETASRSSGSRSQNNYAAEIPDQPARHSVQLPHLLINEQRFFDLVISGDVDAVKEFLQESWLFNINCTNFEGMTALHLAMELKHEDMVNFLLQQKKVDVTDCALHAIRYGYADTLIKILERLKEISPELEYTGCVYSPDFAMNMTPLILAAQCGNYQIIGILLDRGHTIPRPHKPCCLCPEECLRVIQSEDTLLMIMGILDIYRALSNPAFICHISPDPILFAFELSEELITYSRVHAIFKKEFLSIANEVKLFAADLLACCRSCEEVNTLLSQKKGSKLKGDFMFPRLILAMNLKQKEFVAKSHVQQVLEIACLGDWYKWKCYHILIKVLFVIPRIVMLPFIIGVCTFTPRSKLAAHYSLPINRMLSHSAAYIIFLFLIFLQSNKDKTDQRKKMDFTGFEIPIAIFVIGFIWKDIRLCVLQGPKQFFRFRWNIYKMAMDLIFVLHFMFFISAYFQVMTLSNEEQELERKYWHYLDPQLIAEALFAIATIMSYFKLLLLIQVQEHIGPLQVSLGKMIVDCIKYAVLFIIIIISFNVGLSKLYSYYSGMSQIDPDTQQIIRQESPFTDPLDTLKYLFWGLFSVSDPDSANVVIENIPGEEGKTVINEHYITEALGYYAFATYMVLTVIVVLNMMIGTMANTYQKVIDNADVEWVFGRTEVYLAYTQQSVLPPPFNLLPTLAGFKNCKECWRKGFCGRILNLEGKDAEKAEIDKEREDDYPKLMTVLVQRYFKLKKK